LKQQKQEADFKRRYFEEQQDGSGDPLRTAADDVQEQATRRESYEISIDVDSLASQIFHKWQAL